jgi:hypothetical protein
LNPRPTTYKEVALNQAKLQRHSLVRDEGFEPPKGHLEGGSAKPGYSNPAYFSNVFLAGHRGIEPLSLDRRSSVLADAPMPRICIPPTGLEPATLGSTARCAPDCATVGILFPVVLPDGIEPSSLDSESNVVGHYTKGVLFGPPGTIRTCVYWFKARCPWPLDDGGINFNGHRWDSNPQPTVCKTAALPIELRAHYFHGWTAEGFEPSTLWLLTNCSSRLSYAPIECGKDCGRNRTTS